MSESTANIKANISSKSDNFRAGFSAAAQKIQDFRSRIKDLQLTTQKYKLEIIKNAQKLNDYKNKIVETNQKLAAGKITQEKATSLTKKYENAVQQAAIKQDQLKNNITKTNTKINAYKQKIKQASRSTNSFKARLQSVSRETQKFKRALGVTLVALGAGLAYAAKKAIDFQDALTDVTTLTSKSIGVLAEDSLRIAGILKKNAKDVSNGYYQVISAGVKKTSDQLTTLEAAGKLAVGGLGETAGAVDIVTKAYDNFGISQSRAFYVTDQFMAMIREGKITTNELSQSYGDVSASASALGASFEEANASLIKTSKSLGLKKASTAVAQMFNSIAKPTEQAKKKAKELGLEFNQTALQAKGLVKFLKDLKDKTGGNAEALGHLFESTEARKAVIVLLSDGVKGLADEMEVLKNTSGETEKAFKKQRQETGYFAANVGWLILEIGNRLLPVLDAILKPINDLFDMFQKLDPKIRHIIEWVGILTVSMVTLGGLFGYVARIAVAVFQPIAQFLYANMPVLLRALGLFNYLRLVAIPGIVGALSSLAPFIAAGAFVVGVILAIKNNTEGLLTGIKYFISNVKSGINDILSEILPAGKDIGSIFAYIQSGLTVLWDFIGAFLESLWSEIIRRIAIIVWAVAGLVKTITNCIVNFIRTVKKYIKDLVDWLMWAFNSIKDLLVSFSGSINFALESIGIKSEWLVEKLQQVIDKATEARDLYEWITGISEAKQIEREAKERARKIIEKNKKIVEEYNKKKNSKPLKHLASIDKNTKDIKNKLSRYQINFFKAIKDAWQKRLSLGNLTSPQDRFSAAYSSTIGKKQTDPQIVKPTPIYLDGKPVGYLPLSPFKTPQQDQQIRDLFSRLGFGNAQTAVLNY